jgi:hypothetical protein
MRCANMLEFTTFWICDELIPRREMKEEAGHFVSFQHLVPRGISFVRPFLGHLHDILKQAVDPIDTIRNARAVSTFCESRGFPLGCE